MPEARQLAEAVVAALRTGDGRRALLILDQLSPLVGEDLALRARSHAWEAQGHLLTGALDSASLAARAALKGARAAGEPEEGLAPLRTLYGQIQAARSARASAVPLPLPDSPLGRALAAFDAGRREEGVQEAQAAFGSAGGEPREQVLALLALARSPEHAEASIREAAEIADASDDFNLVSAVARAARAAGVDLGVHLFDPSI